MTTKQHKYIAFMAHLPLEEYDEIEKLLLEYDIGSYLIGHETEPYSHYHFVVQMSEQDYCRYRKRVFIDKYKLRGVPKKNLCRQYGKITKIEDFDKLLSYTAKEENIRSNMDEETLNEAISNSFKKEQPKLLKEKLVKYIDDKTYIEMTKEYRFLRKKKVYLLIIEFCLENKIPLTKSILNSYYLYYRQFTKAEKNIYDKENFLKSLIGEYEYNELN